MDSTKPWEQPRIKRILELFGGNVVKIKQLTVRRDANEVRR